MLVGHIWSLFFSQSTSAGVERWLALILIVLRVLISQSKEETILSRLKELGVGMYLCTDIVQRHRRARDDPLNVKDVPITRHGLNSQQLFARYLQIFFNCLGDIIVALLLSGNVIE